MVRTLAGPFAAAVVMVTMLCATTACRVPAPGLEDGRRDLSGALPVFPGAQGFGTDTRAGRGGQVRRVTNLDASGPGSLEDALGGSGPRVVVFDVGGIIRRTAQLFISEPFITVAGQTAPPPGITITGAGLTITTHDVLVQHLRIRPGDAEDGPDPQDRDALQIWGEEHPILTPVGSRRQTFNVVVDHCSLSFATDEILSTWFPTVHDVTISNCVLSHGLDRSLHPEGGHSKGLLIGTGSRRVAVLRNVLAHNVDRNPIFTADSTSLIVNNVVYNPRQFPVAHYGERLCCPSRATVLANLLVPGPSTPPGFPVLHVTDLSHPSTRVQARDNAGGPLLAPGPGRIVDVTQPDVDVQPLTVLPTGQLESTLSRSCGAYPAFRDSEDLLVMEDLRTRGGRIIDHPSEGGGVPDVAPTQRLAMVPAQPEVDPDGNGYTNLEEWLHRQAASVETMP